MIDALIRWSLGNRAAVILIALVLTGYGVRTALSMPVDVFPDLTAPTVTVVTEAHGMAPTEVEAQVTYPIETALNGAPGVRRVRSSTSVGISIVWVEFEWDTDPFEARQTVTERLAVVSAGLPPEVERPSLTPASSIMAEILFLGLTSKDENEIDALELRTLADVVVRRRLLSVPGVAQVTPIGGAKKQIQVVLDPELLRAHGISIDRVSEVVAGANENVSAGFASEGGIELLVQGRGRVQSLADVGATVVTSVDGVPVRVRDLGVVREGAALRRGTGSLDAVPAVVLGVQKQPATNTLTLTAEIDRVLDELEADLPGAVTLHRDVFRQADFIEVAVDNVAEALRDGAILVVVLMLLFLANVRAALITLTAIPLSLVVSVLVLSALGATVNTMTLGGMAIAIGALVDDAVIDVENVLRRLRENAGRPAGERRSAWRVVLDASVEIRTSIVFATFIIALVFLPLFFLSGVEGRFMRPLGVAYVVAILTSLVVAVTVTPVLCHLLLPGSRAVTKSREPALARVLKGAYRRFLDPLLDRPWLVITPGLALLAVAILGARNMGLAFLPEFQEGALTIGTVTLPGTSLEESDALGRATERIVLEHPEVATVARRTGRAELDEHALGVEASELEVTLRPSDRPREDFLAALRNDLALLPGTSVTIGQPISHRIDHVLSGTRASIAVKLFGPDLARLRLVAEEIRAVMESVRGVVDLSVEQQRDIPLLVVRFDRDAMARHGVSIQEASHALEAAHNGFLASEVLEGNAVFDLVVRVDPPPGADPAATLAAILVDAPGGPGGHKVPLSELAEIRRDVGPNTISREAVERKLVVSCNVAGRDVGSVVEECQAGIDPIVAGEPGYRVEYGGQFESATAARRTLMILGAVVFLGVGFLLHLAFRSARDAVLVMVNLPLALIGGVAGVHLLGGVLSIAALIGFITVFGIATRNGIMLVSHVRHLQREEGVSSPRDAVLRGAEERLVPILMTALATMLALVPLALGGGEPGNEIQTPMAVVILCGLATSMLLNMLVVPVLVLRFGATAPAGPDTEVPA